MLRSSFGKPHPSFGERGDELKAFPANMKIDGGFHEVGLKRLFWVRSFSWARAGHMLLLGGKGTGWRVAIVDGHI